MKLKEILDPVAHYKFDDGFECILDYCGIIYIKYPNEEFERPCMKCCYDVIKARNISIAKFMLAKACEIQNNLEVTKRAGMYASL